MAKKKTESKTVADKPAAVAEPVEAPKPKVQKLSQAIKQHEITSGSFVIEGSRLIICAYDIYGVKHDREIIIDKDSVDLTID